MAIFPGAAFVRLDVLVRDQVHAGHNQQLSLVAKILVGPTNTSVTSELTTATLRADSTVIAL
jgi:hypothetical protein